jgi:methionine-rich copper-binding protein CopC
MTTLKMSISAAGIAIAMSIAGVASAHSFPESQTPSAGQKLASAPAEVTINFDAPIEKLFAKLEVTGADGRDEAAGAPQISDDGRHMSVKVASLKPGEYTVKWAVVGIDTHHTEGSYTFSISSGGS